jgi:arginase family enzyme
MIDKRKEYSYTGIPTFFKSDYGTIEQLSDYQIGVFGIPMDTGVCNRFGARLGPLLSGKRPLGSIQAPNSSKEP